MTRQRGPRVPVAVVRDQLRDLIERIDPGPSSYYFDDILAE